MQDRYAGDIGDYGKIALLRSLQAQGLSIGVNWYKVQTLESEKKADGAFRQKDGKYQIPENLRQCDPILADTLTQIFFSDDRSIESIEKADLIPGTLYYNEPITVAARNEWHREALRKLKEANIVFVDPDNGLLVKSVGKDSARSVKYTFYEEVKDYIEQGQSVLIYNHRSRKPEEQYFCEIYDKIHIHTGVSVDHILKITFPKRSVRDYMALAVSEEHIMKIRSAFSDMAQGIWGELGACRIL